MCSDDELDSPILEPGGDTGESHFRDPEKAITEISQAVSAAELFEAYAFYQVVPPWDATEPEYGTNTANLETAALALYPAMGCSADSPDPYTSTYVGHCLCALFEQRKKVQVPAHPDELEMLLASQRRDAGFVRGTGYPHQTEGEILGIQEPFSAQFEAACGVGPSRAIQLLRAIVSAQNRKAEDLAPQLQLAGLAFLERWHAEGGPNATSEPFADLANEEAARCSGGERFLLDQIPGAISVDRADARLAETADTPSREEWEAVQRLLGLTQERRGELKAVEDVQQYPLYVLPNARVLLGDLSHALDRLFLALEAVAKEDPRLWARYARHRGRWLEDEAVRLLRRVFSAEHVFRDLRYDDPDTPGGEAQLDIAVHWPPYLILVEAKSSQFRLAGQLGDIGRLRTDLRANIEQAFEQALRAVRHIRTRPSAAFRADSGALEVRLEETERLILCTLSLHLLASLPTRLASISEALNMFPDPELPWSLALTDLDIITEFSLGPESFVHYALRRIELEREPTQIVGDETDYFMAYLQTRLLRENFPPGPEDRHIILLTHWQVALDQLMASRAGWGPPAQPVRMRLPAFVKRALADLREDQESRRTAVAVLSLTNSGLDELDAILAGAAFAGGVGQGPIVRRFADGDTVVVVVAHPLHHGDVRDLVETEVGAARTNTGCSLAIGLSGLVVENTILEHTGCVAG